MASTHVDIDKAEWTPGIPFYGAAAVYEGRDIVQLKILSDRGQPASDPGSSKDAPGAQDETDPWPGKLGCHFPS